MKKLNLLIIILLTSGLAIGQDKDISNPKKVKAEIKVSGKCGMCKTRIEEALDISGVRFAEWNKETQMLNLVYNSEKISLEEIEQRVADVGHDTPNYKADDKAYKSLHACCKYRE